MDRLEVIVEGAAHRDEPTPQISSDPGRSPQPTAPSIRLRPNAPCPFCGSDPPLATQRHGRFQVGCESDDCHVNPQVSGASLGEAWARWNTRPARA